MVRRIGHGILLAATLMLAPASAWAANATVNVGNGRTISPTTVTVNPGDSVTWNWVGGDFDHIIASSPGGQLESWDSHPGSDNPSRLPADTFVKTFTRSGSFTYVCRVHPDRMRGTVNVTGVPVAAVTATPSNPFTGEEVAFDASGSTDVGGSITKYEWDLDGDGVYELDTLAAATTTRSYPAVSTVVTRVRVTDNGGHVATATQLVTVRSRAPSASFTASPLAPAKGQVVTFDAAGTTDPDGSVITAYDWDLNGDGTFETPGGTSPPTTTRAYTAAGPATVGLRVTDADGNTGTTTRGVTVTNQAPVAQLTVSDPAPLTGTSVTLDASTSSDPDGTVASYQWDLDGDGTFEPNGLTSSTIARSFPRAGDRTVRVRVVDNDGTTHAAAVVVTVGNRGPTAAFTFAPVAAVAGSPVSFNGAGSTDPEGTALTYAWDLDGNGTFETAASTSATASRTYAAAGPVTVQLRVTDPDGGISELAQVVSVGAAPPPPPPPPPPPSVSPAPAAGPTAPPLATAVPNVAPALRAEAPALTVAAASGQRSLKRGAVSIRVTCSSACSLKAGGSVSVRGRARKLRLVAVVRSVASGGSAALTLKLAARDVARLRRAMRGARVATATVLVTPTAGAGRRVTISSRG